MTITLKFLSLVFVAQAQAPGAPPAPPPVQPGQVIQPTQPVDPAQSVQALPGSATNGTVNNGTVGAQGSDPNLRNSNDPLSGLLDPFEYQARGRRDPFTKPTVDKPVAEGAYHGPFLPLQRFNLTDLKLTAIIWDVSRPKAMIIDPEQKVHIVGPNTRVGKNNGYIAAIREGEIVVVETNEEEGNLISSTKILRIVK